MPQRTFGRSLATSDPEPKEGLRIPSSSLSSVRIQIRASPQYQLSPSTVATALSSLALGPYTNKARLAFAARGLRLSFAELISLSTAVVLLASEFPRLSYLALACLLCSLARSRFGLLVRLPPSPTYPGIPRERQRVQHSYPPSSIYPSPPDLAAGRKRTNATDAPILASKQAPRTNKQASHAMPVQPSTTVQVPNPDDAGQRDGRPDQEGIAAAKGTDTSEQVATPSMGGSEPNADLEARVETGSHVGASGYVAEDVHLRPGGSSGLAATSPRDTLKASLALGGHSKSGECLSVVYESVGHPCLIWQAGTRRWHQTWMYAPLLHATSACLAFHRPVCNCMLTLVTGTLLDNETTPGKDGQPSSSRLASASPPSIRASSPGDQPLRRSAASRRSHMLASTLLSQLACTICRKSLRDPITIPCGHSVCATCITARVHLAMRAAPSAPCSSHVPPRLPLSTLTLPCPVSACPRGAVGRGLGIWTGHHCRYGAPHPLEERDDFFDSASSSTYPGSPPLDGFITGVQDHPLRLSVIPAQPKGQSHLFALPAISSGSENESTSRSADLLRMDVTLSKALGILRRYADAVQTDRPSRRSTPPRQAQPALGSTAGPSASRRRARVAARGRSRRLTSQARSQRGRAGAGSFRGHDQDSGEPDDRRVQLTRTGAALLGASEADLESGTVGGVRAVSDTEEEDEDDYAAGSRSFDDEEDEEEGEDAASGSSALWPSITSRTGQASAPSPDNRRYRAQHKRRRRTTLPGPAREAAFRTRGLPAETETTESGWDTENSATAASGSLDARKRWQELAEAYDRGGPTDVAKLRPDAQCHGAIGVGATTTFKDKSPPRASHTAEALHAKLLDTLECQLCYCLLYMPLTTPCGHTFCKPCFARSLDHGNKCPLCRTQMPPFSFFQEHPSNAALMRLLISEIDVEALDSKIEEKVLTGEFPPTATYETQSAEHASKQAGATALVDESRESWGLNALYQERKTAVEQEEREARLSTPIFVCTLAFPGMPTILHIFEPRYRLMVRRCLESGNPR